MSAKTSRRRRSPRRTGELRLQIGAASEAACPGWAAAVEPRELQLCAQAQRALEFAIGSECRDEALQDLVLVDVVPDPTVRRLRGPAEMDEEDRARRLQRLVAARGFLRSQVAGAIHRKRTPELVFELLRDVAGKEGRTA
jgi:ribosome-binding factor A